MLEKDESAIEQIWIRNNELGAAMRLYTSQVEADIQSVNRGELPDEGKSRDLVQSIAKVSTDLAWSEAMIRLMERGTLGPTTIMEIWDNKDDISRTMRDEKQKPR